MQLLPAKQRAVLVLRDGLGWPARDVAEFLDDSTAAVNSALQRARERIAREHDEGTLARLHAPTDARAEAAVLREFLDAWAEVDVPRIVALLSDDALLTMPPVDVRIRGAGSDRRVLRDPAGGRPARAHPAHRHTSERPTRAGQLRRRARHRHPRRVRGDGLRRRGATAIAGITGFPHDLELFAQLGLPTALR